MFNWQPNPSDPEIFHITHVDNLVSIAAHGLVSDAKVAAGAAAPVTIGSSSIKARRLTWRLNLPDRPRVGDFVSFYFCPRSEMLYRVFRGHSSWNGGQAGVVHLVSRVSRVTGIGRRLIFTDVNAATAYHYASEDLAQLPTHVDWSVMGLSQWSSASVPRQAEFLVHNHVPWSAFERIVVMDPALIVRVGAVLRVAPGPLVQLDPTWYY